MVEAFAGRSLIGKARGAGLLDLRCHDLRSEATDVHRSVDDSPFGGGAGMVLMPEPLFAAVEKVQPPRPLYFLGPAGRRFDQAIARELADGDGFSLLCGRYEGVDARVVDHLCDGELSLGDFVLNGGEVAAMAVVEAVGRLLPGVMGNDTSADDESFSDGLLEYPQYTRPANFREWDVPDVLRSGDHGKIARWRRAQALARTMERRPDLIQARGGLTDEDRRILVEFGLADE
ncbi:MAG: tRNA (guanosine(37)-N1)-methyltransferase TrmD [Acidimicrobiales bacterium]|nr:tRNA (guanosine(37)-N1)-methyltransferase TrmD [Acidimicrobiales bacterium]